MIVVMKIQIIMYQLLFDNGCEYENKNYNDNNKYGTTMSRLQTHDIDNESALILNCKKQYQSKLISFLPIIP